MNGPPCECSPFASWLGAAILLPLIETAGRLTPDSVNRRHRQRWRRFVEREFSGYFSDSNRRTQQLTGLDLESIGYHVGETERP